MKALILNSGNGTRMGELTENSPKCLTRLQEDETILSRQLKILYKQGIAEFVITTGKYHAMIQQYVEKLHIPATFTFVQNPLAQTTNYIYSMSLVDFLQEDIILLHGDLVFAPEVAQKVIHCDSSCMVISSTSPLPEKDFKAVLQEGYVQKVGVEFFRDAVAAQPFYRLNEDAWKAWKEEIHSFCKQGNTAVYAENALNNLDLGQTLWGLDCKNMFCGEIDTLQDLLRIKEQLL